MSITCGHCGKSHDSAAEVRTCSLKRGSPSEVGAGTLHKTSRIPRATTAPRAISKTPTPTGESPYRSSPGHDLFVTLGPNVEAWNDSSATAGGSCSCGWTKYGLANQTAVVLSWNRHIDQQGIAATLNQRRCDVGEGRAQKSW